MKSPQYPQEESTSSIAQRLLQRKKLTQEFFYKDKNKTAEDRRLNDFYKEEKEIKKEK